MNHYTKALSLTVGAVAVLAAAGGCARRPIVVQAPPATVIQAPAAAPANVTVTPSVAPPVVVMKEAPPPPRYESMPPRPTSDNVWIPGYWAWRNGQTEWVAGHWDIPPRPGSTWVSSRWEKQGEGYVFIQGYWQ